MFYYCYFYRFSTNEIQVYTKYYRASVFVAVAPKIRYTELFSQNCGEAKQEGHPGAHAPTGHVVQRHRDVDSIFLHNTARIETPKWGKYVTSGRWFTI